MIKQFGEVTIAAIITQFKEIDEGEVTVKPVVIPTNPYLSGCLSVGLATETLKLTHY